jgi:glycosyltransferase involved in cell wall biosynthesis
MRIGINASFLRKPGTGIGQVTCNFLEKLQEFSISNFQFPINDSKVKISKIEDEKIEIILYTEESVDMELPENFKIRNFLPWWKRDDLVRKWLWERQVAQEAEKDGCEVFLSLYQTATFFPQTFRHVMIVHDLIPRLFPEYQGNMRQRWHWKAVERGILQASQIIAVSESTKNDLVEFGRDGGTIEIAYPDAAPVFLKEVSVEDSKRVLQKYSLTPGYLYHGGGLEIRKNGERLLGAYKMLVEQSLTSGISVPPLVISGKIFSEDNRLATPVRSIIRELHLENQVRLLDFVPEEDLPALYKNALFFIYPSLYEGFGLPVIEAFHMGTPVMTSDVASLPEVARDAALYIDPESVPSIASGLERLLVDSTLRKTLGEVSRQELTRFGWVQFTEKVIRVLKH